MAETGRPKTLNEDDWILVVDDEPGYRDLLRWHLGEQGFHVKTARDGAEALVLAAAYHVAVIITDMTMPRLDGLRLLEEMRHRAPDTAVIIVTGFGTVETGVSAIKNGAVDFILKPFDLEELSKKVSSIMGLPPALGH